MIAYSAIGCLDAEHSGPMFIQHFHARDNEQALNIGEWTILNVGDVVGAVVLGHSISLDPEIVPESVYEFVQKVKAQIAWTKRELAKFSPVHIGTNKAWFDQYLLILEEYLTWWDINSSC